MNNSKLKHYLGEDKTDLQAKINKIVNQDYIDTSFSHTLQMGIKNAPSKDKLYPKDVFNNSSNDRKKGEKGEKGKKGQKGKGQVVTAKKKGGGCGCH
jgi:hypothetical protein